MFGKPGILDAAGALSAHAAAVQAAVARNVANADSPGYRAVDVAPFEAVLDAGAEMTATRPGHLAGPAGGRTYETVLRSAPGAASPNGNGVSVEGEMVRAAEARREHDLALSIYRSSLDLLRSSLGRR